MTIDTSSVEALRGEIVGFRFPTGSLSVEGYENWLACDSLASVQLPDDVLHPGWILIGGFRGMGTSLTELFTLVGAAEDAGVMLGETTIEQTKPLRVGHRYAVEGEILDVVRRTGSRLGLFDLVTFQVRVLDDDGALAASSTNTFVVPRRRTA